MIFRDSALAHKYLDGKEGGGTCPDRITGAVSERLIGSYFF
jgi:hypothetical protein